MVAAVEAPLSPFSGCRGSRSRRPRRRGGSWSGRFSRVKGYRPDGSPAEADTIDAVRAIERGVGTLDPDGGRG